MNLEGTLFNLVWETIPALGEPIVEWKGVQPCEVPAVMHNGEKAVLEQRACVGGKESVGGGG